MQSTFKYKTERDVGPFIIYTENLFEIKILQDHLADAGDSYNPSYSLCL